MYRVTHYVHCFELAQIGLSVGIILNRDSVCTNTYDDTYQPIIKATQGPLVLILRSLKVAYWASSLRLKQNLSIDSYATENKKRIQHEFKVCDEVLLGRRPRIQPKIEDP